MRLWAGSMSCSVALLLQTYSGDMEDSREGEPFRSVGFPAAGCVLGCPGKEAELGGGKDICEFLGSGKYLGSWVMVLKIAR